MTYYVRMQFGYNFQIVLTPCITMLFGFSLLGVTLEAPGNVGQMSIVGLVFAYSICTACLCLCAFY